MSGAEQSLRLLLRNLDRRRVTPIFGGPARGPFPEALTAEDVTVVPVEFGRLRDLRGVTATVRWLRRVMDEHAIDLLHSNGPQTNVCAGLAARRSRVPVVWHARNLVAGRMWDIDRMAAALATRIICNSEAIRDRFRGSGAWAKSVTIQNAVDTALFSPDVPRARFRDEMGLGRDEPGIGLVGRVGRGKGHDYFVEAAIRLLGDGLAARFFIIGDPLFDEDRWRVRSLQHRIKDAGWADRIRLTGFRHDMPEVMRGLDVVVMASDAEACGRVLFEAMASGTAIVATNTGGTPEIVRDKREALLVPPRDPAALASAIAILARDHELGRRLGSAGVARVRETFTVERHVGRTLEVYAEALAACRPRGGPR